MSWFVVYTKPRAEQKVAKALEKIDVEVYCPCVTEVRQWSDRKKKLTTPLFKSYVFVNLAEKDRSVVFEIPGAVRYLYWLGKPAVVRDTEIETIKAWMNDEEVEDISLEHLSPGDKLEISNGSLKGQEAIIKEIGKKRMRLILPKLGFTVNAKIKEIL